MTNDEAKTVYQQGIGKLDSGDFSGALELFDLLEADRPNSRHVMYHRALCLIKLQRVAEAREVCQRLDGKLEPDRMADLKMKLAQAAAAQAAPAPAAPAPAGRNVFVIEAAHPVSASQCTVTGAVESGVLHTGDSLSVLSDEGLLLEASILRIGTADTPLNLVRAGQKTVLLLGIEATHIAPGMRATSSAQEEAYAATLVVSTQPAEDLMQERNAELSDVERALKRGDFAGALAGLESYLQRDPNSIAAYRLSARVYLESPEHKDPKSALMAIRKAYELGGADDPVVIGILSQALAENGEPEQGLRFLERLYAGNIAPDARIALNKRIQEYRTQYGLGHVWEFADQYGDVIFEAKSVEEAVKAIKNKTVGLDAKCRRDRLGDWRPIEVALAPDHPEIAALYQGGASGSGMGKGFMIVALVLLVAIVVAMMTLL